VRRSIAAALATMALLVAFPVAARADQPFDVPASACVTGGDSAPAIERFLAGVPNGSIVVFPQEAKCEVTRTVDLGVPPTGAAQREATTIELNGATIFRTTEPACKKIDDCNGPIVALNLVDDVTLQGGSIQGGQHVDGLPQFDATREHDHGIAVHGSQNVTLFGLHVSDVAGDCVDVDKQKKDDAGNIRLLGTPGRPFTCEGAGRQGVSANAVTDLHIQGLQFDRIASTAIDLEPRHNGFIDTAVVQDNRFGWVGSYAIAGIGGSETWKDVRVEHNVQTDPDHPGDAFLRAGNSFDRGPLTIVRNRIRARIQLNHTSGSAAGNVLLPGSSVRCMFELFNGPPFKVADSNRHPASTQLTCALEGKIANGGIVGTARKLRKYVTPAIVVFVLLVAGLAWFLVRRRRRRRTGTAPPAAAAPVSPVPEASPPGDEHEVDGPLFGDSDPNAAATDPDRPAGPTPVARGTPPDGPDRT
jgi:hypothetical protein